MARREFTKAVKVEIIKRATRNSVVYCEQCKLPTKKFDIDHIKADALEVDKSGKLTAEDGQLLCSGSRETCHGKKTAEQDIPNAARAKRREANDLGVRKAPTLKGAPFPKSEKPAKYAPRPPRPMFY